MVVSSSKSGGRSNYGNGCNIRNSIRGRSNCGNGCNIRNGIRGSGGKSTEE